MPFQPRNTLIGLQRQYFEKMNQESEFRIPIAAYFDIMEVLDFIIALIDNEIEQVKIILVEDETNDLTINLAMVGCNANDRITQFPTMGGVDQGLFAITEPCPPNCQIDIDGDDLKRVISNTRMKKVP